MLRMLLFFMKLALVVAAAAAIADNSGNMSVEWGEYIIRTNSGFAAALLLVSVLLFGCIYHLWRRFVGIPKVVSDYRREQRRVKGFESVTRGFLSLAAGDEAGAKYYAARAEELLPHTTLTLLLKAQSASLNGDKAMTREIYMKLTDSKEGAFFGIRGLLSQAFKIGNRAEALVLARKAYKLEPKRPWVVFLLLELEILHRNRKEAHLLLKKAEKIGVFNEITAKQWRAALFSDEAAEIFENNKDTKNYLAAIRKAFKADPEFIPAVLMYVRGLVHTGSRRKAIKIIRESWLRTRHPALLKEYVRLYGSMFGRAVTYKDIEDFTEKYPRDPERLITLGRLALEQNLYGLARSCLTGAIENGGDIRAYRLLETLNQKTAGDGRNNPKHDENQEILPEEAGWYCEMIGVRFPEWTAFNPQNGAFNTVVWGIPHRSGKMPAIPVRSAVDSTVFPGFTAG